MMASCNYLYDHYTSCSDETMTIWGAWSGSATATATCTVVWGEWNQAYTSAAVSVAPQYTLVEPTPLTQEEKAKLRADIERRHQEHTARESELAAKRATAEKRAEELLRSLITKEQEKGWAKNKTFELTVEGGDQPARHYRIYHGHIRKLDKPGGQEMESWCVHPSGRVLLPMADVQLAQLLHLRHDDLGLRKVANVTRLRAA